MTFGESVNTCLTKYVTFQGRASRSEYWWWTLFNLVIVTAAAIIDHLLGTTFKITNPVTGDVQALAYGWVYAVAALGLFLPSLSVMVRRLHDKDRSGWYYWLILVPIVGAFLLLYWFVTRGTAGSNRYGYDPLAGDVAETFR